MRNTLLVLILLIGNCFAQIPTISNVLDKGGFNNPDHSTCWGCINGDELGIISRIGEFTVWLDNTPQGFSKLGNTHNCNYNYEWISWDYGHRDRECVSGEAILQNYHVYKITINARSKYATAYFKRPHNICGNFLDFLLEVVNTNDGGIKIVPYLKTCPELSWSEVFDYKDENLH